MVQEGGRFKGGGGGTRARLLHLVAWSGLILVLCAVLGVGALRLYLGSDALRQRIEQDLGSYLGARLTLQQTEVEGLSSLVLSGLTAQFDDPALCLVRMKARRVVVRSRLPFLVSHPDEVTVDGLEVVIRRSGELPAFLRSQPDGALSDVPERIEVRGDLLLESPAAAGGVLEILSGIACEAVREGSGPYSFHASARSLLGQVSPRLHRQPDAPWITVAGVLAGGRDWEVETGWVAGPQIDRLLALFDLPQIAAQWLGASAILAFRGQVGLGKAAADAAGQDSVRPHVEGAVSVRDVRFVAAPGVIASRLSGDVALEVRGTDFAFRAERGSIAPFALEFHGLRLPCDELQVVRRFASHPPSDPAVPLIEVSWRLSGEIETSEPAQAAAARQRPSGKGGGGGGRVIYRYFYPLPPEASSAARRTDAVSELVGEGLSEQILKRMARRWAGPLFISPGTSGRFRVRWPRGGGSQTYRDGPWVQAELLRPNQSGTARETSLSISGRLRFTSRREHGGQWGVVMEGIRFQARGLRLRLGELDSVGRTRELVLEEARTRAEPAAGGKKARLSIVRLDKDRTRIELHAAFSQLRVSDGVQRRDIGPLRPQLALAVTFGRHEVVVEKARIETRLGASLQTAFTLTDPAGEIRLRGYVEANHLPILETVRWAGIDLRDFEGFDPRTWLHVRYDFKGTPRRLEVRKRLSLERLGYSNPDKRLTLENARLTLEDTGMIEIDFARFSAPGGGRGGEGATAAGSSPVSESARKKSQGSGRSDLGSDQGER